MSVEWKRRFWSTTISGYIGVVLRLLLGLILFRQMFSELTSAEFGFWALLWSLFGYGILLDFGFGFTAQKAVAEKTAVGDTPGLSRLLSTIFWTYVFMSLVLLTIFLCIRSPFLKGMSVHPEDMSEFGQAYLVFFIGLSIMFPLGLFPEILRGLQRSDLANWIGIGSTLLNFSFILWGLKADWPFPVLMGASVITSAMQNLAAAIISVRKLPGLSLSPRLFDWRSVRVQMGFSLVAYLITFSNLVMAKSDQLVISLTIGVSAVVIYQAGFKMGEMLNTFSVQLQGMLSPAAASLRASGDDEGLKQLLMQSSRITFLLVTPLYVLSAVYLEPLISILTGMKSVPHSTWWIGQVLLLAVYSSQLTNSCSKRVMMMCGKEKKLLAMSIGDALANVVLSIILAYQFGVLGVSIGTLVPTMLVGWFWIVPLTLKTLDVKFFDFIKFHFQGTTLPLLAFGVVIAALVIWIPAARDSDFIALGWRGIICMVPLMILGFPTIRSITR
ncbi:oligosaccharide flippase family protein [Luteolibacter pohnpeiensis]|uniref:Oligosaccharide flippase family protein n=1 Tax=Luteolibacter pohnpeiensis TaxID=454153 RepID=A0A934S740_9BACT|nr:oligosaccharide flippase family protein [Luteolibacter pohnpeiensis]MBK1882419.1 oligosaccharide flippase family protein [Luteolibacter pohnpeiensis]